MIRRILEVSAIAATAVFLVATSQAPRQCTPETLNLRAETTCGQPAQLGVASTNACAVSVAGASFGGLPSTGFVNSAGEMGSVKQGFELSGRVVPDGGNVSCDVTPADGGFSISCRGECIVQADGGCPDAICSGTLIPQ